jgi:DNA repair exonuclease SbcCD ATPase subunit
LRQAVTTWGLLRQDAIRAALEAAGGALHERLSGLVGLEQVSSFAASASNASAGLVRERTAARKLRDAAVLRHEQARERLRLARAAADAATDRSRMLADSLARISVATGLPISLPAEVSIDTVTQLGSAVGRIAETLEGLAAGRRELARYPRDTDDLVREAAAAVGEAETAVAASAERAPAFIQLATSAMSLLGDRCPVCDQEIDEASVRAHLEEVLAESRELAAAAQSTQDGLVRAQAELARLRGAVSARRDAEDRVRAAEAAARQATAAVVPYLDLESAALDDRLLERLIQLRSELRELYRDVNRASGAETLRIADEADEARRAAETAQRAVDELDARCERAKALERGAHRAAETILARALEDLQPSFAEVFDRLAPNPAFTRLSARQDVMRNRNQIMPVVTDMERGIDANPSLVFSDGQLNTVALSYFLGMALNARDASLPFLILDDPLQSFDVVAILGFSDLCRHIREHRQLLITTHDRRFADVLERKLSPREPESTLVVHNFEGWSREGPTVMTRRPDVQPVMWLLRGEAS